MTSGGNYGISHYIVRRIDLELGNEAKQSGPSIPHKEADYKNESVSMKQGENK